MMAIEVLGRAWFLRLFRAFMRPLRNSIKALGREIQVRPYRIAENVIGKWGATADTTSRLGKHFNVSPEVWLGLEID